MNALGERTRPEGSCRDKERRPERGGRKRRRGLVLLALSFAPAAAAAQQATVTHVAGSVHRIDGAVDNIVVSAGEDGLLMVDTGYPFAVDGVKEILREIAGKDEPDVLVTTHQHHAFSVQLYAGDDTRIIAHRNAAERMARTTLMAGTLLAPFPEGARADSTFEDSLTLRFNGEEIVLLHLPRAHTDGDIVAWFKGSGVLAAGDVFVPHQPWISLDAGADVEGLLAALDRLIEMIPDDVVVVPGHDRTSSMADVRALRSMVAEAADTVSARLARGLSLLETQRLGLPAGLEAWQGAGVSQDLFLESLYRSLVEVRENPDAPTLAFTNGHWFEDGAFRDGPMYSVRGVLTVRAPARVDRTIDLRGGSAVPAFGEAHTHRFGALSSLDTDHAAFLRDGVFYALVQDPAAQLTDAHRQAAADPDLVDVVYTQGVITPSWGIIPAFYEAMAAAGRYGEGVSGSDLEGSLYFVADDVTELERRWPEIRTRNDRFVKVIVAFTDELEARRTDPAAYPAGLPRFSARPGVTPEVLGRLVRLAHEDGLWVSAHIETVADFRAAIAAGVDWIAHMPASWQIGAETGVEDPTAWRLTPADAFGARMARIPVSTTLSIAPGDPREREFREAHAHNLAVLAEAGAPLAIGSDLFAGTSVDEALQLASFDALSDAEIFTLLAVHTPRLIFPERRIGHLREGYEASFLVLGGDPTVDLEAIRDIRLRVKNGVPLP